MYYEGHGAHDEVGDVDCSTQTQNAKLSFFAGFRGCLKCMNSLLFAMVMMDLIEVDDDDDDDDDDTD